ncbi:MAG: hypothetical protein METHP_01501 [Methanoregula sp. SKADARSKE-2]|nr:MAG: hypothetical protein METHP_01501 [Methanoregula sp. SKADARSKE-2]
MSVAELKEAFALLGRFPVLWIPGLVAGFLGALFWVLLNLDGTFFASRLIVIFGLILLLFIAGMLVLLKNGQGDVKTMFTGGIHYYFRILLPLLVIIFADTLIFIAGVVVLTASGIPPDAMLMEVLAFAISVPVFILTIFFDTAAVFEEGRIFDSIRRSIGIVAARFGEVLRYLILNALLSIVIGFGLLLVWNGLLYDKLAPLQSYTQIRAFTPTELSTMFGTTGVWITAVVIFVGLFLLIPILYSYKACFFKKISGNLPIITQASTTGEYDSKGRWYKY